jgi:hypothetical protein
VQVIQLNKSISNKLHYLCKLEQFVRDDLGVKVRNIGQLVLKLEGGHIGSHTDTKISDEQTRGPRTVCGP